MNLFQIMNDMNKPEHQQNMGKVFEGLMLIPALFEKVSSIEKKVTETHILIERAVYLAEKEGLPL